MKKIFYYMHIEWGWIKQRPQFLVESLAEHYDMTVVHRRMYNRKKMQKKEREYEKTIRIIPIYAIPFLDRFRKLKRINREIVNFVVRTKMKKYKYVLINQPEQIGSIPANYSGVIMYDCMDDHSEFTDDVRIKEQTESLERKLVKRANIIFASSNNLKKLLETKYCNEIKNDIHVVRNGYDGNVIEIDIEEKKDMDAECTKKYVIAYFGTVSSWFNFDFIKSSLELYDNIEYRIIGPRDVSDAPKHDRINYVGVIEHDELYDAVKDVDLLILPFKVNKLIESVDPVKLYEYINMNKNILCCYYDEISRFEPFVYFYTDFESYIQQLKNLMGMKNVKYSPSEREKFLAENSWKVRAMEIKNIIENYEKEKGTL